ncbi:MAG: hypothetical protein IMF15_07655 [Proteobacteria bacterium]|nr:hypothetical protein [Pseudomonadota bacterium]
MNVTPCPVCQIIKAKQLEDIADKKSRNEKNPLLQKNIYLVGADFSHSAMSLRPGSIENSTAN